MNNAEMLDKLLVKMIEFDSGDPKRIQHFLKVHSYARLICGRENVDEHTRFLTEAAAIVHDIGIHPAEAKYGSCSGKLQELEGPAHARKLLEELDFDKADIERVCYLVAHHHTYDNIDGVDYQILVEADFLVNFYEDGLSTDAIVSACNKLFRTDAGKQLCKLCFDKG